MPKLNHRKSQNGCIRCKKRKVKCDETHPACRACQRHGVTCKYLDRPGNGSASPAPCVMTARQGSFSPSDEHNGELPQALLTREANRAALELRLFHYYLTETITAFQDAPRFWHTRMPLLAFKNRFVFQSLISLAAMDLYRRTVGVCSSEPAAITVRRSSKTEYIDWQPTQADHSFFLAGHTPNDMYDISQTYFDSVIEGQRRTLDNLNEASFEPAFVANTVIMLIALISLGCPEQDGDYQSSILRNEGLWFRLASGTHQIVQNWMQFTGADVLRRAGYFKNADPDYADDDEIFHSRHQAPFCLLLHWGNEFENISSDEQQAYERAVSFIGLVYKWVSDGDKSAAINAAFLQIFAAKIPPPFPRLVLEERPRALVIVAHLFALMRLLEHNIPHFRGIATRQIPNIHGRLPYGWKKTLKWPLSIIAREPGLKGPLPSPPCLEDL